MPSFGYTLSGGGTGTNDAVVYWDLSGTYPHTRFYPYTNTSGSPILVSAATLLNVVGVGSFSAYRVLVYDSINEFGGLPERLIGESDVLASLTTGSNSFTFSTPFIVDVGTRVWVAVIGNPSGGFSTALSVSGAQRAISETVEWGIQKENWGYVANNPFPGTTGWIRTNIAVPVDLSGAVATLPVDNVRVALSVSEPLAEGVPNVRVSLTCVETLHPVEPEGSMITTTLPALSGLAFNVTKRPTFSTRIDTAQSGHEVTSADQAFPIWEFEFTYDYLPDVGAGETDLKNLTGFFIQNQGSYGKWLFQDPDDYQVTGGAIGTGDGVTVQWYLCRVLGLYEPVGQVAWTDSKSFAATDVTVATSSVTITAHGFANGAGPYQLRTTGALPTGVVIDTNYWIHVVDANTIQFATSQANAIAGTVVSLSAQGSGTDTLFSPAVQVYVNGVLQTSGYIVKMPNLLIFDTAPAAGAVITATFNFYFLCRFLEDKMDFSKFADKLWELQKMDFRSKLT